MFGGRVGREWGEQRGEKTRREVTGSCSLDVRKGSVKRDSKIQAAESRTDSKMMPAF